MPDSFTFDLVSPEKLLLSEDVEMVVVPGAEDSAEGGGEQSKEEGAEEGEGIFCCSIRNCDHESTTCSLWDHPITRTSWRRCRRRLAALQVLVEEEPT